MQESQIDLNKVYESKDDFWTEELSRNHSKYILELNAPGIVTQVAFN